MSRQPTLNMIARIRTVLPMPRPIRLATRALILINNRLLLVNAFPGAQSDLWCAPGGGADPHASLPENLKRELREETGLEIAVGAPVLVNEFHDPRRDFHQVDVYFRCIALNDLPDAWTDPECVVTTRRLFARSDMAGIRFKPDSLPDVAWATSDAIAYDALEPLVR